MTTDSTSDFDAEALINAHPQAALIRRVQRTGYQAFSGTHKLGLTALSWLAGPFAGVGFAAMDDHLEHQADECLSAVHQLLQVLGTSASDRRIIALLLADHPGRHPQIAAQLRAHLQRCT
ncbi:MAG: hypothetical protein ACOVNL_00550 [Prochlorococcaceae cyanobacterium]|jgi:hypothetical protein